MVVAGRQKSIAFFIALGIGLISVILLLYIGWVLLDWRTGILLFFGILLLAMIIGGVVLNTIFLVREIRRNEQHDTFINAVTHELKTPVASIRLYLQTLQSRDIDETKRLEFYNVMLADSDRLQNTIEQVLRAGAAGRTGRHLNRSTIDLAELVRECLTLAGRRQPRGRPRRHIHTAAARRSEIRRMSKVLVVEDEEHLATGLRFNLEAEGYGVEVAVTGEDALARLTEGERRFDLVVLDVMLPGKDG